MQQPIRARRPAPITQRVLAAVHAPARYGSTRRTPGAIEGATRMRTAPATESDRK